MVLGIRPAFVGGPLHGQPVEPRVVELGQDFVAVEYPEAHEIRWALMTGMEALTNAEAIDLNMIRYTPKDVVITCFPHPDIRDVAKILMWVDTRLCEQGRDLKIMEIIRANGWHYQLWRQGEVIRHAQPEGTEAERQERQEEMQAEQVPDQRGREQSP